MKGARSGRAALGRERRDTNVFAEELSQAAPPGSSPGRVGWVTVAA